MKLDDVMTIQEVEEQYGIKYTTVKKAILNGKFTDRELRKSAGTWLILRSAVIKLWNHKIS